MTGAAGGALDARVVAHVGGFRLDVEVTVAASEVLAVLGPNGSGKSTLLAAIAGHLAPSAGVVRIGERVLVRAASIGGDEAGGGDIPTVDVDLAERSVGLLGQHPLLFPHLSALETDPDAAILLSLVLLLVSVVVLVTLRDRWLRGGGTP